MRLDAPPWRAIHLDGSPLDETTAPVLGALASFVDVTGITRDRAAVDAAEAIGRSAFDRSTTPMCIIDPAGRLIDWNRSFATRLDRPDYELIATPFEHWVASDRSVIDELASEGPVAVLPAKWHDGERVVVRAWRAGRAPGGRTMIEIAPPAWTRTA